MNYPKIIQIKDIKKENSDVKTLFFDYPKLTHPGQFFMVWVPTIDEIPMSISYVENDSKGITFKRVGESTNALFNLKIGDKLGIRGPYGNGFNLTGKRILFIGGGTGIATLAPTVKNAIDKKISAMVILGAKKKNELFFEERLKNYGADLKISTDDGSLGFKGLATDLAREIINKEKFDSIITCGPELMMKKLFDITKNIPFQASLERYMKCGIGICGQCCVGKGLRVCEEGPVFDRKTLKNIEDFGIFKRDAAGRKVKF
jgi:dihydroorotate dehydrogenase electron transfer subunit